MTIHPWFFVLWWRLGIRSFDALIWCTSWITSLPEDFSKAWPRRVESFWRACLDLTMKQHETTCSPWLWFCFKPRQFITSFGVDLSYFLGRVIQNQLPKCCLRMRRFSHSHELVPTNNPHEQCSKNRKCHSTIPADYKTGFLLVPSGHFT